LLAALLVASGASACTGGSSSGGDSAYRAAALDTPSCLPATLPGGWTVHRVLTEPPLVPMYGVSAASHADGDWTIGGTTPGTLAAVGPAAQPRWSPAGETPLGAPDTNTGVVERLSADGDLEWIAWADDAPFLFVAGGVPDGGVLIWGPVTETTALRVSGRPPVEATVPGTPSAPGYAQPNLLVARIAPDGEVAWMRVFGLHDVDSYYAAGLIGESATALPDGGVALVGRTGQGLLVESASAAPLADFRAEDERAPFVLRLDADGEVLWARVPQPSNSGTRISEPAPYGANGVAVIVGMYNDMVAYDRDGAITLEGKLGANTGSRRLEGLLELPDGDLLAHGTLPKPYVGRYSHEGDQYQGGPIGQFTETPMIGGRFGPATAYGGRYYAGVTDGAFTLGFGVETFSFPGDGGALFDFIVALGPNTEVMGAVMLSGSSANFGWGAHMSASPEAHLRVVSPRTGPSALVTPEGRLELLRDADWDPFDFDASRTLMLELEPTDAAPNVETCGDWWHPAE